MKAGLLFIAALSIFTLTNGVVPKKPLNDSLCEFSSDTTFYENGNIKSITLTINDRACLNNKR